MLNKLIVLVFFAAALALSCNHGLSGSSGGQVQNGRIDRSQRTVMDGAGYVDFTAKATNTGRYTKADVLFELGGTYRIAGGNSTITINRQEGTISLSSDNAYFDGRDGRNMYAKYSFDVQAADQSCLYIKMGDKKKATLLVDGRSFSGYAVPDIAVCVPLYGYSRNRIEVSPIMAGYAALPSGTYWAVKP
jgi:hypothetical protein